MRAGSALFTLGLAPQGLCRPGDPTTLPPINRQRILIRSFTTKISATFADPSPLNGLGALRIVDVGIQNGAARALRRGRLPTYASDQEERSADDEADGEENCAPFDPAARTVFV